MLVGYWTVNDGDLLLLIDRQRGLRLRVMLMMVWFFMVRFVERISLGMTLLMRLLILGVGGSVLLSLMLVVTCLEFVVAGTLSFLIFIVFFIAISRAVVNHDGRGGTAPDPLVWSAGALHKRRRLGSCGSGPVFFARATWYLALGLVSGSSCCYLC